MPLIPRRRTCLLVLLLAHACLLPRAPGRRAVAGRHRPPRARTSSSSSPTTSAGTRWASCSGSRATRAVPVVQDAEHGPPGGRGRAVPQRVRGELAVLAEPGVLPHGPLQPHNGVVNNHTPFQRGATSRTPRCCGRPATRPATSASGTGTASATGRASTTPPASSARAASSIARILVNGKKTPTKGWVDDVTTDYAIAVPEEAARGTSRSTSCSASRRPTARARRRSGRSERFAGETPRPVPNLDDGVPYRTQPEAPQAAARAQWAPTRESSTTSAASPRSTTTSAAARRRSTS